jgi:hypothetical protein
MRPPATKPAMDHMRQLQLSIGLANRRWTLKEIAAGAGVDYQAVVRARNGQMLSYANGKAIEVWLTAQYTPEDLGIVLAFLGGASREEIVAQQGCPVDRIDAALRAAL